MKPVTLTFRRGFSLIELLVVISIIAIVLALTFPMISAMQRDNSTSAGINSVTIAVTAARRYATNPNYRFVLTDINPGNAKPDEPGMYSGVAAVFTPAGEIRLTKNTEGALYHGGHGTIYPLERIGPWIPPTPANPSLSEQDPGLPKREFNGFMDINLDYVLLGSDVGVAGITRDYTKLKNDEPLIIPPPFAVWFDQNGYQITTGYDQYSNAMNLYQYVYYDGDHDNDYNIKSSRWNVSGGYNPNEWNPHQAEFDDAHYNGNQERAKYELPFDRLEAVIGVFVYSQAKFDDAVANGTLEPWETGVGDNTHNKDYWDWMQKNGRMILFSRQTGMVMRNRDE